MNRFYSYFQSAETPAGYLEGQYSYGSNFILSEDWNNYSQGSEFILKDKSRIIKSVNDINFVGNNIVVTRKGKQVDVGVVGDGGTFYNSETNPSLTITMAHGDRWYSLNDARLYTWVGFWVEM